MQYDQNKYLSVGEFAKLLNTTRATLVHYDDLGVLQPAKIGENGYRYYLPEQAQTYLMILLFGECGLTLKDIKGYLATLDVEHGKDLVDHALDQVSKRMRKLNQVKRLMESKKSLYEMSLEHEYEKPFLRAFEERRYFLSRVRGVSASQQQLQTDHSISICRYVMDHDEFPEHPFSACIQVCEENGQVKVIRQRERLNDVDVYTQPQGLYACLLHHGCRYRLDAILQQLADIAAEHHLRLAGDVFMTDTVNFTITNNEDEYSVLFQAFLSS